MYRRGRPATVEGCVGAALCSAEVVEEGKSGGRRTGETEDRGQRAEDCGPSTARNDPDYNPILAGRRPAVTVQANGAV